MKLRCTIGSIGVVGTRINVSGGDEFEIDGRGGKALVQAGYAVNLIEPPVIPEPEGIPPDNVPKLTEPKSKSSRRRK